MKFRSILLGALCAMAITAGFTSCSDDEDNSWKEGSKVELSNTRAFILNEGKKGLNNASLIYFDYAANAVTNTSCIFQQQNGMNMGDVGNDIITYNGRILVVVNTSNYIAMLNGSGVELARLSFEGTDLGLVRDIATYGNYAYVSSYGGYLTKVKIGDSSLTIEKSVELGTYPEDVVVNDGKVYCSVSGWGADNRVAVVDANDFDEVEYVDVMVNPDNLAVVDGHVYVQGYGPFAADWSCPYPWGEIKDGKYTELGNAHIFTAGPGKIYAVLSKTNWSTYKTTTTFSVYDVATGTMDNNYFKNMPEKLATTSIYGISVNPYTDYVYVTTTSYTSDGAIYVFDETGNYVTTFSSYGINPKQLVFLKN